MADREVVSANDVHAEQLARFGGTPEVSEPVAEDKFPEEESTEEEQQPEVEAPQEAPEEVEAQSVPVTVVNAQASEPTPEG